MSLTKTDFLSATTTTVAYPGGQFEIFEDTLDDTHICRSEFYSCVINLFCLHRLSGFKFPLSHRGKNKHVERAGIIHSASCQRQSLPQAIIESASRNDKIQPLLGPSNELQFKSPQSLL